MSLFNNSSWSCDEVSAFSPSVIQICGMGSADDVYSLRIFADISEAACDLMLKPSTILVILSLISSASTNPSGFFKRPLRTSQECLCGVLFDVTCDMLGIILLWLYFESWHSHFSITSSTSVRGNALRGICLKMC